MKASTLLNNLRYCFSPLDSGLLVWSHLRCFYWWHPAARGTQGQLARLLQAVPTPAHPEHIRPGRPARSASGPPSAASRSAHWQTRTGHRTSRQCHLSKRIRERQPLWALCPIPFQNMLRRITKSHTRTGRRRKDLSSNHICTSRAPTKPGNRKQRSQWEIKSWGCLTSVYEDVENIWTVQRNEQVPDSQSLEYMVVSQCPFQSHLITTRGRRRLHRANSKGKHTSMDLFRIHLYSKIISNLCLSCCLSHTHIRI